MKDAMWVAAAWLLILFDIWMLLLLLGRPVL